MRLKATKFKINWHHSLSVELFDEYWVAGITMFYDPQLSAEVLKEYLPPSVVNNMFKALEGAADDEEVEIEFDCSLPWPWRPDAMALKEAFIFPGTHEKPGTLLSFVEDGFRLKIKMEGSIERYFPAELKWMAHKLWAKFMSNPLVFHGVIKEEPIVKINQPAVG